ncbi:hypothetical protein PDK26_05290 [Bacillus cereus]|nr:hypothetical protein [Bacillus cereus]
MQEKEILNIVKIIVPHDNAIDIGAGLSIERPIETSRDDLEIIGVLIDYDPSIPINKQKTSVTKQVRDSHHRWIVSFFNADGNNTKIKYSILCVQRFI